MVTTHLGKYNDKKVSDIREIIREQMMNGEALLNAEVLFYVLHDKVGVPHYAAADFALHVFRGGSKVTSKGLKEVLADTKFEMEQRQITAFIKRYMKSSRIELLKETPKEWQMNGFSSFEGPYIAGFERYKPGTVTPVQSESQSFNELINERLTLKSQIEEINNTLKDKGLNILLLNKKNEMKSELEKIEAEISKKKFI